ncbi:AAA family ATPase [Cryobacterium sp. 10S3]|uniref:AAA family ATPase n=1 Tax=Cryobacterium sp. 10S3 TaxID=3048582 RepID=UPI002AC9429F|nr:AAA family ATPase [Cryobacterium sp. 10S3]MEB0285234.1 AAA family ATPase [Cryobacterium sp. 10S3]WPX12561.1 AAA family ATPase [Cryobacterium sp. 10S3]
MWRLDRKQDDDDILSTNPDAPSGEPRNAVSPQTVSLGDPSVVAGNIAEPVWNRWRTELAEIGGRSPLLHFADEPRTRIELSQAHPGGLPQFITGKSTLLSNLIRDELALRNARLAAGEITQKGIELRSMRGIESVHLGIGLAEWRFGDVDFLGPVLLRPLAIRRYGRDFELKLKGQPFLNPELGRALHEQFQITLDADAFVALAVTNGAFKPQPVIDRLRGLTSHLPWFNVTPRLVASSFADVGRAMKADAAHLEHPLLDAIAGNPSARQAIEGAYNPVVPIGQDSRPPATDVLLLDADPEQENVVAQIAAGNSLVVKTLPGTGGTQTIVNAIGSLISQHKRVLVVSARRSSLDGINQRLTQVGLPGVAVTPRLLRRDLIASITRNEKAVQPMVGDVDDALVRLRKVLLDYRGALTRRDPALGVSVLDALGELARLAQLSSPPSTTARLERHALERLAQNRATAAQTLIKAAALGQFRYGPGDSPWYGASFAVPAEASAAHQLAKRVNQVELPRLLERAAGLVGQTRLRPFETIAELGVYLRLLLDIRDTLDKFQPAVFDRSLTELISATSARRDSPDMTGTSRRRLRRLAEEYLRPGVHVTDLNDSLRRIQQQRTLWQRYVVAGVMPEVPVGISDVHVAFQRVSEDLAALDIPLRNTGTNRQLAMRPVKELIYTISGLAAESEVLANLHERTALLATLREHNLDPLMTDLAKRHVSEENVANELELAWWQSVLETMLGADKALLNANTQVLDRLEADFRLVDEAHASTTGQRLGWLLAETWKIGIVDWPEEADRLRRLLRADRATPSRLNKAAPHLGRVLAPVWLASPYEVSKLDDQHFDAVLLVDAGATTLAENVGAIRRGKQIVAFGDPVTQTPSPFETGITDAGGGTNANARVSRVSLADRAERETNVDALHADSALARLGELLPTLTLTRSYRAGGKDLTELVNHRFYGGRIDSLPWAGSYLGHGSLTLNYVAGGHGMPDADSGAVESVDAEVTKVVDLVLDHAVKRPRESLMVITASARHAVRVHQAVLSAFSKRTDLADFILKDRAEPFTVLTLEQAVAQSRDRVIFSIGYGRTPHGRLLTNFGSLGEPGGDRLLAIGMTRARRAMDIVSCFRPADIDEDRQRHGILALAQVLTETEARHNEAQVPDATEPMLVDLAQRLERLGVTVTLGHRGKLALAGSHAGRAVVVETDAVVDRASLRESLRLRPEVLRRLGWHYLRVHSFELFSNPDAVATRVAGLVGVTPPTPPAAQYPHA